MKRKRRLVINLDNSHRNADWLKQLPQAKQDQEAGEQVTEMFRRRRRKAMTKAMQAKTVEAWLLDAIEGAQVVHVISADEWSFLFRVRDAHGWREGIYYKASDPNAPEFELADEYRTICPTPPGEKGK